MIAAAVTVAAATGGFAIAGAPAAMAHEPTPGACDSGKFCFWVDADYAGSRGVLSTANNQWSAFPQAGCPQGNWNDCASSIRNQRGSNVRVFKNTYQATSYGYFDIPHNTWQAHLGGINWANVSGQVGDAISSNN
jgi:hypothetical protein